MLNASEGLPLGSLNAALLMQQHLGAAAALGTSANAPATPAPTSAVAAAALASNSLANGASFDSSLQAQALLKHQEDQLRMARLILQQRQVEELFGGASNALLQEQLLLRGAAGSVGNVGNASSLVPPGIDQGVSLMQNGSQRSLSHTHGIMGAVASRNLFAGHGLSPASKSIGSESNTKALPIGTDEGDVSNESKSSVTEAKPEKREAEASFVADEDAPEQEQEEEVDDDEYYKESNDNNDNGAMRASNETFPLKLYRMIIEAEKNGQSDIVSFFSHGRAFSIHKPREFVSEIMSKYFTTSRMTSFQRQLNLYGFRRITEGKDKGGYFHEHFLKGRRRLCQKIKRKRASVKAPPNFFTSTNPLAQQACAFRANQDLLRNPGGAADLTALGGAHPGSLLDLAAQGLIASGSGSSVPQGLASNFIRPQGYLPAEFAASNPANTDGYIEFLLQQARQQQR